MLPYFFDKYLSIQKESIFTNEDDKNIDLLQKVEISNSENIIDIKNYFNELIMSTFIHLFELLIYMPFAFYYEEEEGQINDLIIRIFLLKRKNMLLTSFFTFYLGYKLFIRLLKKLSPSAIELVWFYFALFGSVFGLTIGRDFMAATIPEKVLRIIGISIIVVIIYIKSISPPFPSYLSHYDSSIIQSNTPFYVFIEKDQQNSNYYLSLNENGQNEYS